MSRLRWVVLILAVVSLGCQQDTVNDSGGESGSTTTQNETHIAVWGDVMVVAWNDIGELGYRTEYGYSTNGGQTWHDAGSVGGSLGERTAGDPAVAVDNTGIFYLATMVTKFNGDYAIGVYRSTQLSPAVRFGAPVLVGGPEFESAPTDLQDRPSIAVDLTTGLDTSGNVYLCWTDIRAALGTAKLKFVRSRPPTETAALNFGDLRELNTEGQDPGTACNIGVGPSGEVYVTWIAGVGTSAQKIYVRKSVNGGETFEPAVEVDSPPPSGDWNGPNAPSASRDCSIDRPNMRALNGHIRLADAPVIAVDRNAGSQYKGTVYIAYSADGDGNDDADVFVVRLPNGGATGLSWSAPIAIHKSPASQGADGPDMTSNDTWMPAIAVSSSGAVAVSFYDRRRDVPANRKIDVYAALSTDGGVNWTNQPVTSASFDVPRLYPTNFNTWTAPCYMGDYNGIATAGTVFHLVWGDNSKVVRDFNFPDGRPDPNIKYKRLPGP